MSAIRGIYDPPLPLAQTKTSLTEGQYKTVNATVFYGAHRNRRREATLVFSRVLLLDAAAVAVLAPEQVRERGRRGLEDVVA
tara:strand:- start:86 stop:331 length:246 start_codon:yes stop_codon:yes gene_type:complete